MAVAVVVEWTVAMVVIVVEEVVEEQSSCRVVAVVVPKGLSATVFVSVSENSFQLQPQRPLQCVVDDFSADAVVER